MKITNVRARLLVFPLPTVFRPAWARGRPMHEITMVLVEVETDEGITGRGVAHAGEEALTAIDQFVRPYFVGQDPMAVEVLTAVLRDAEILGPPVYHMEIPLWDIIGKRAGLPVYKLWGGYQNGVPAYCATGEVRSVEARVEDARRAMGEGFRAIKLRFHHEDPRDDLGVVRALRADVGEKLEIIVDANQAGVEPGLAGHRTWGYQMAYRIARELEELGVLWLEEPLPRHDYDGLARLRASLNTLMLAGGEDNHGMHEFKLLLDRGCYDILQPDALQCEGIFQLRKVAALAEAANCLLVPHTWGNGMGLLANLHLAASIPNCPWLEFPHDPPSGFTARSRDCMLAEPLWIDADGRVAVPERPGFGFELDDEAVQFHTVRETPA
jgi:D-galactarolactone cycloisomerase